MKRKFSSLSRDDDLSGTPFQCIKIFRDFALSKAKEDNFVFSPCSIQLAISLITNGATGNTLEVLLKFLEAKDQHQLKSHASKLISILTEFGSKGPKLSFVGGLWVEQSRKVTTKFKSDAETIYKAKAENVDFRNNAKEMIQTVNRWAAESTNGLVDSLLPKNSINEKTRVVLANSLYFKGRWSEPFLKEITRDFPFYLRGQGSVQVPFMSNRKGKQFIKTFDNLKVLRLPYEKSSLSMYVLLPDARDGLWPLVEEVSSDPLILGKYASSMIQSVLVGSFRVPKFKINYKFEASDVLKAMGLGLCYSEKAEFDGVVVGGRIKVEKMYHRSHIEVEEEGTKAAASTAVIMRRKLCGKSRPPPMVRIDFVADHPFMYVVKDDKSGMVLFMGYVVNPALK